MGSQPTPRFNLNPEFSPKEKVGKLQFHNPFSLSYDYCTQGLTHTLPATKGHIGTGTPLAAPIPPGTGQPRVPAPSCGAPARTGHHAPGNARPRFNLRVTVSTQAQYA